MTKSSLLYVSHATNVAPRTQVCRERGLLAAAALGESHLHVSTLGPGEVLGLGLFHRRPDTSSDVALWPRHTGGRALPSGSEFLTVTIALPHRAALVSEDRQALAPDQVMNRCVRGILHALRSLGVDVVYPGLDLLTHERRAIGALSFVEIDGPTLFQAILPWAATFADGPRLLDRADPQGLVPVNFLGPGDTTSLRAVVGPAIESETPAVFARRLATGYRSVFGLQSQEIDDEVTEVLADAYASDEARAEPPNPTGPGAQTAGLLGPVEAWAQVGHERITGLTLAGDFIAPVKTPRALGAALRGCATTKAAIEREVTGFLNRDESYILGLRPAEVVDLVHRAANV